LLGKSGFVNGGVQLRSKPATKPPNEMIGYQAGCRRRLVGRALRRIAPKQVLVKPDAEAVKKSGLKKDEWKKYHDPLRGKKRFKHGLTERR
jgi:hypothetical protein